jgi:hypothetical protein
MMITNGVAPMTVDLPTPLPVSADGSPDDIVPLCTRVTCCACRALLTRDQSEPVPSQPGKYRCGDEDACRNRYTPRRLARSVRKFP